MSIHLDSASAEPNPFELQPKPLFPTVLTGERDPPSRAHHAVPGQSVRSLKRPDGQSRRAGSTRERRDLAVRRHATPRDARDHGSDAAESWPWRAAQRGCTLVPGRTGVAGRKCPRAAATAKVGAFYVRRFGSTSHWRVPHEVPRSSGSCCRPTTSGSPRGSMRRCWASGAGGSPRAGSTSTAAR
jgi:hypothetical protein